MSNGIYAQILDAVRTTLTTLLESSGWTVVLHRKPAYDQSFGVLPGVIVAPPEDLAEVVVEETFPDANFPQGAAWLGFPVFVGSFVDARAQQEDPLFGRTNVRETIRLALWKARVLGLETIGEYNVRYDPKGPGGEKPPAQVLGTWQKFTFEFETARSN